MSVSERLYRVSQVAKELDRSPHTVRTWERLKLTPQRLRSVRDERGWRVWTGAQIEGLKDWIVQTDRRPGKGIVRRDL